MARGIGLTGRFSRNSGRVDWNGAALNLCDCALYGLLCVAISYLSERGWPDHLQRRES